MRPLYSCQGHTHPFHRHARGRVFFVVCIWAPVGVWGCLLPFILSCGTSLCLSFSTCKMGAVIDPTSECCHETSGSSRLQGQLEKCVRCSECSVHVTLVEKRECEPWRGERPAIACAETELGVGTAVPRRLPLGFGPAVGLRD